MIKFFKFVKNAQCKYVKLVQFGGKMFKKIFINLCAERGEAPSAVCKKIGISAAAFSQWDESTVPRKVTQIKIAEYFGVSVDYLLERTNNPNMQK